MFLKACLPYHDLMDHNESMTNIIKKILLTLCLLPTLNGANAAAYKSVDKDGNVSYSDSPGKSAEKLNLPPLPVINISPSPEIGLSPKQKKTQEQQTYSQLIFEQPKNDETIRSNAGNILVKLLIEPELQENHTILLKSNGKDVAQSKLNTFTLQHLDRGTHTLQASIINADGKTLRSSETITLHLHRHSQLIQRSQ